MKSEPLQVRVLERSFIFEAKTEHSIQVGCANFFL